MFPFRSCCARYGVYVPASESKSPWSRPRRRHHLLLRSLPPPPRQRVLDGNHRTPGISNRVPLVSASLREYARCLGIVVIHLPRYSCTPVLHLRPFFGSLDPVFGLPRLVARLPYESRDSPDAAAWSRSPGERERLELVFWGSWLRHACSVLRSSSVLRFVASEICIAQFCCGFGG